MSTSGIGFLVAAILIAVIWFVFVAPSERRYHDKKLRLLQERIERRRRHQQKQTEQTPDSVDADS